MSILRFDPFRDPFRDLDRMTSQLVSGVRTPALMPMDAWRSGEAFHVALDVPGIDPGSIELTVERNTLTVQAERRTSLGEDDQVLVAERPQGGFTRQLVLGEGADADRVQAECRDGVLHLTIPVKESEKPRRISVGSSSGQDAPKVIDVSDKQSDQQADRQADRQPEGASR